MSMDRVFEPVLAVYGWWDRPRAGVAQFRGTPHVYRSLWDEEADDWSEIYTLSPVDENTLSLILEDYEIWRRWRLAFDAGKVDLKSGPALPEDQRRSAELKQVVPSFLQRAAAPITRARAEFRRRTDADPTKDPYNMEVHWEIMS